MVGRRDQAGVDAVGEPGPRARQEVTEAPGLGPGLAIVLAEGQHRRVPFRGQGQGCGVKDAIDLLPELRGLAMWLRIVRALGVLDMLLRLLQSMEHACVMCGLRKDPSASSGQALGDHGAVILAQIGDDDLRVIALSP